jgi:predicted dehydrogenase
VYVAATNDQHFNCCQAAIAAGKHVLSEKPLVTGAAQARILAAQAADAGVLLMEALWTRLLPTVQKAQEWAAAGRIGNPRSFKASLCARRDPEEYPRLFDPALGGGALLDLGIYGLHLARHFARDRKLLNVRASSVPADTGVDISGFMLLEYEGGFTAELACSIGFFARNEAYLCGDLGYIRIAPWFSSAPKIELIVHCGAGGKEEHILDEFAVDTPSGFEFEIMHFMDCVRRGETQSPVIPLADTIEAGEIMDLIRTAPGPATAGA